MQQYAPLPTEEPTESAAVSSLPASVVPDRRLMVLVGEDSRALNAGGGYNTAWMIKFRVYSYENIRVYFTGRIGIFRA